MRLLDRYLLREFLLPFFYCLDAFVMLWVVLELFGSLDDFIEHHIRLPQILQYYLVSFPDAFVQIIPMTLLLGLLFCLATLGKSNELLAMRAGGVSPARLAVPFLLIGLTLAGVVFVINEFFAPGARAHTRALRRQFRGKGDTPVVENLFYMNRPANRDWSVQRFFADARTMENVEIHERTPAGQPRRVVFAERARWIDSQWLFSGVEIHDYQATTNQNFTITRAALTNLTNLTERPALLLMENKLPDEMSATELRRASRYQRELGRAERASRYQVALASRYAFPLTSLMVLWIGLPLGMTIHRGGALKSVGFSLLLVITYYFLNTIAMTLGSAGRLPPVLAAWLPNLLFLLVGAALFARRR